MAGKEYLSVQELGEVLSIKVKTIYGWVGRGAIPVYRLEGVIRFKREEIESWLKEQRIKEFDFTNGKAGDIEDEMQ